MGRQSNTARRQAQSAREKAAAVRAAAQRRERRRRVWLIAVTGAAVVAVIIGIAAVGALSSHSKKPGAARVVAASAVVDAVTGVPSSTLDSIGKGSVVSAPKAVTGAALTAGGKPEVLFVGAEYCPYCAAERWGLVQALSRFGTFHGLASIHSSPTDVYPNTATFSFYGASYESPTISFAARELETMTGRPLQSLDAQQAMLWHRYTGEPGSFPFLDIAGRYVVTGPSYDPAVLKGLTAEQIASQLADPSSSVAKAVDGTANVLTAAICKATGGQPAAVCGAAGVATAAKALGG